MSRAAQQAGNRQNVPAQLPQHQHHRQLSPQRPVNTIHNQQQMMQLPRGENSDFLYEEFDYMGDFDNQQVVECAQLQPQPQQLHRQQPQLHQVSTGQPHDYPRRLNITELFRRGCPTVGPAAASPNPNTDLGFRNQLGSMGSHAELYPQTGYNPPPPSPLLQHVQNPPEYFYEQRNVQRSAPMHITSNMNNLPLNPVFRKRIINNPTMGSFHKVLPQAQVQPQSLKHLQAQASQTQYFNEDDVFRLPQQQQQFDYMQPHILLQPPHELYQQSSACALAQLPPVQQQRHCECAGTLPRVTATIANHDHRPNNQMILRETNGDTMTNERNRVNVPKNSGIVSPVAVPEARPMRPPSKKHPITVRTPRFIRRPVNSSLFKRPSALCLPLTVQPDPAQFSKRNKQKPSFTPSPTPPYISSETHSQDPSAGDVGHTSNSKKQQQQQQTQNKRSVMDEEIVNLFQTGDGLGLPNEFNEKYADFTKARLDAIMKRYDKIFRNDPKPPQDQQIQQPKQQFNLYSRDIQQLKPRTPPGLKQQIKTSSKDKELPVLKLQDIGKAETLQVEEMTTDMLDELMAELTQNGFNENDFQRQKILPEKDKDRIQEQQAQYEQHNKHIEQSLVPSTIGNTQISEEVKEAPKSYNYEELKESMAKAKLEYAESVTSRKSSTHSTVKRGMSSKKSETTTTTTIRSKTAKIIPRIMVDDAMELHRTKSYVINLIDTALSRHLATIEEVGSVKKQEEKMEEATSTQQILNPHKCNDCPKSSNKDLAEEIAQVLNDNFTGCCNSRHSNMSKGISECSCKTSRGCCGSCVSDEPQFVKQLRQMRWGHLKHIQQEMRRLEELERFLDSCNMSSFDKCHYH